MSVCWTWNAHWIVLHGMFYHLNWEVTNELKWNEAGKRRTFHLITDSFARKINDHIRCDALQIYIRTMLRVDFHISPGCLFACWWLFWYFIVASKLSPTQHQYNEIVYTVSTSVGITLRADVHIYLRVFSLNEMLIIPIWQCISIANVCNTVKLNSG